MSEPETIDTTAVVVPEKTSGIVRAAPGDVAEAFEEYRKIQSTLDASMPDCIMAIRGKQFRKKKIWSFANRSLTTPAEEMNESFSFFTGLAIC